MRPGRSAKLARQKRALDRLWVRLSSLKARMVREGRNHEFHEITTLEVEAENLRAKGIES